MLLKEHCKFILLLSCMKAVFAPSTCIGSRISMHSIHLVSQIRFRENNYAHIFDLLSRLRQAVDHPYLIVYSKTAAKRNADSNAVANGTVDCEMCHEPPTDRILSSCCGAGYCRSCVVEYLTVGDGTNTPCPSCSAPFTIDLNQATSAAVVDDATLTVSAPKSAKGTSSSKATLKEMTHVATGSILRRINLAEFATSTKIEVLVQELVEMRTKRPGSKALVFSQFVNMVRTMKKFSNCFYCSFSY